MNLPLAHISRYRGELMGAAMVFIVLFHVWLPRTDAFFGLRRTGNIGVDIFFFLSGMGLWFAWTKLRAAGGSTFRSALSTFYRRRFLRIYPAWLIMASLYYVPDYLNHGGHSATLTDLLGDILINWDFWLHDELTFWYIPATLMLYLFAPFYMELVRRLPLYRWLPVAMVMWCAIVQWVVPIHQAVGHIEIFWSRVPIFFIGINMGEMIRRRDELPTSTLPLILLMFIMPFAASVWLEQMRHGKFPLFIERMLYIPLTVSGSLLLALFFAVSERWQVGQVAWLNRSLVFIGKHSLEIYLIHAHFVLKYVQAWHLGYWPTAVLTMLATLPLAWVLHRVAEAVSTRVESLLQKNKSLQ
ncbi:MAG: acyltransferase [Prevotella sp.]|nr:acyltransferase [Prevotella sp.]